MHVLRSGEYLQQQEEASSLNVFRQQWKSILDFVHRQFHFCFDFC